MKKRFYAKKVKKRSNLPKLFIFIVLLIVSFSYTFKNLKINIDDDIIINYILSNNNEILSFENLTSPEFLLNYTFNSSVNLDETVFSEESSDPLIYIYNTHPTEYYAETSFEVFNITPTVITASYMLKEYLEDYGIYSIVETDTTTELIYANDDWTYSNSYDASRILLEDAIEAYPTVEYYIDIHRDAASKETTTTTINDVSCAKLMFVIGAEYETFEKNYELADSINNLLLGISTDFTRGIILKQGEYVDGVYNQDLDENIILVEVGAQYNTVDEVNCAIEYLAESIATVILGDS